MSTLFTFIPYCKKHHRFQTESHRWIHGDELPKYREYKESQGKPTYIEHAECDFCAKEQTKKPS